MSIKKKYDPSPGSEEESFSDMLSPSRTSNTYNTSRNLNPPSCPTVNEELEPDYNKSILTKENNPSVNLLTPQIRQASCTSRESIEKTKAKVIINAPSSIKNRPVNLKLINRRPTGFIRLTNEELSRDSSLYRGASSKLSQQSIEEQLGAVTLRVPAKINKPVNLKIVHRRPTGFIRTPPEADKSEDDEDDEDDETSTLNSIEEIPGNIIACAHGTANKNNQFEDYVCVDCPNYTKFQEHDKDQVKEFSPKRGDNGDEESCTDDYENNSETNEFNNENDPVKREDESSSEELSSNSSDNDSNEDQESESNRINNDHRKDNLIQMTDGTQEISGDVDSGSSTSNESNEKRSQESAEVESEDDGSQISLTSDNSSNKMYQYQDQSELCNENHSSTESTDDKTEDNVSETSQDKEYPELQDFDQSPFEDLDQKTEYAVNNPIPDKWDIAISRLKLHQEHARTRGLIQIPTDPTGPTDDKNESESSSVSTQVPSLACCGIVKDYIPLEGSNESVGYIERTKDSNSGSSIILEESNEENSKTMNESKPNSLDDIIDEAGSPKERARDRKVVTLIEDKTVVDLIEDKPKNIKILKRHPTGLIRTVHEYEIEKRKNLKGPARFAFQYESFIIRDYWKKSKPAIKSIPVGGPPPSLPKRPKRK